MNRKPKTRWLIAGGLVCIAAAASAEDVYVKLPVANILAGKSAGTEHIAQVKKGDKLQVIAKEGSWLKVKAGEKEGYVFKNSVSDTATSKDDKGFLNVLGGSSASAATNAEAGKGVGESLAFARSKGMSTAGLDRMIQLRKSITASDWATFTSEGHVGSEKK
jgi:uncharacterized protein YgiM (DUF1202 family)